MKQNSRLQHHNKAQENLLQLLIDHSEHFMKLGPIPLAYCLSKLLSLVDHDTGLKVLRDYRDLDPEQCRLVGADTRNIKPPPLLTLVGNHHHNLIKNNKENTMLQNEQLIVSVDEPEIPADTYKAEFNGAKLEENTHGQAIRWYFTLKSGPGIGSTISSLTNRRFGNTSKATQFLRGLTGKQTPQGIDINGLKGTLVEITLETRPLNGFLKITQVRQEQR